MAQHGKPRRRPAAPSIRQARLHPAFAHLYPMIAPGRWYTAAEVSARILFLRYGQEGLDAFERRPLDERHFEFRGGWSRETGGWLTRATDGDEAVAGS